MNRNFKRTGVALALSLPLLGVAAPAMATQNHTDPCPGQHNQVYNSNSFVLIPHFTCGGGAGPKGDKGDTGAAGPKGDTGAASTVPGPKGDTGDTGPQGLAGAASTVPGPKGDTGAAGPKGDAGADSTVPGPKGAAGVNGAEGKNGLVKTVIVHEDGTQEVVKPLPKTGATHGNWGYAAAGSALVASGAGVVLWNRRRHI